jgi:hypothetical protein
MEKSVVFTAVQSAVSSETATKGKWAKAGSLVAQAYPDETALKAEKEDFCNKAIVPALREELRTALTMDIPRKGTDDYNVDPTKWDKLKDLRKDATATRDTLYRKVVEFAWPKEKTAPTPRPVLVWLKEHIMAISTKLDKVDGTDAAEEFDIVAMKRAIAAAYATLPKNID